MWECLNCKKWQNVQSKYEEPKAPFKVYIRDDGGEILEVNHDCGGGTKGLCQYRPWSMGDYDEFLQMGPDEVAIVEARSFADKYGRYLSSHGWTNAHVKLFFREMLPKYVEGLRPSIKGVKFY